MDDKSRHLKAPQTSKPTSLLKIIFLSVFFLGAWVWFVARGVKRPDELGFGITSVKKVRMHLTVVARGILTFSSTNPINHLSCGGLPGRSHSKRRLQCDWQSDIRSKLVERTRVNIW